MSRDHLLGWPSAAHLIADAHEPERRPQRTPSAPRLSKAEQALRRGLDVHAALERKVAAPQPWAVIPAGTRPWLVIPAETGIRELEQGAIYKLTLELGSGCMGLRYARWLGDGFGVAFFEPNDARITRTKRALFNNNPGWTVTVLEKVVA